MTNQDTIQVGQQTLTRKESISLGGCYFQYYGTINISDTNEVRHLIIFHNMIEDKYDVVKSLSQDEWKLSNDHTNLLNFANQYLGIK